MSAKFWQANGIPGEKLLQDTGPRASIFRAFNSLGWELFKNPRIGGIQADMFYCGSGNEAAQANVHQLIEDVGLRPVWLGGLEIADAVDGIGRIWVTLAIRHGWGSRLAINVLQP